MAATSGTVSLASVVRDLKEYAQAIMKSEGSTEYDRAKAKEIKEIAETAFHHLDKIVADLAPRSWDPSGHRIHPTPGSEVVEELFDTIRTFVSRELGELTLFDRARRVFTQFLSPEAISKAKGLTDEIARCEANSIRRQIAAKNDRIIIANTADEPFLKLFSTMPAALQHLTRSYLPEYTKEDAIRISIANIYEIFRINPPEGLRKLIEFTNEYKIPLKFIHEKFGDHTKEMAEITRELTFVDLRGFSELFPSTGLLMHLTTFLKKCTKAQEIFIFPLSVPVIQFVAFSGPNLCNLKALPVIIQAALIKSLDSLATLLIFGYISDNDPAYARYVWKLCQGESLPAFADELPAPAPPPHDPGSSSRDDELPPLEDVGV